MQISNNTQLLTEEIVEKWRDYIEIHGACFKESENFCQVLLEQKLPLILIVPIYVGHPISCVKKYPNKFCLLNPYEISSYKTFCLTTIFQEQKGQLVINSALFNQVKFLQIRINQNPNTIRWIHNIILSC